MNLRRVTRREGSLCDDYTEKRIFAVQVMSRSFQNPVKFLTATSLTCNYAFVATARSMKGRLRTSESRGMAARY
eukprot:6214246-Pleurochrysis_carterae.AAC.6